jgi:hypothetical protein
MVPREVWTVEELCAAIHARLKPARDLLSKFSFALPSLHLALWPEAIQGALEDMAWKMREAVA